MAGVHVLSKELAELVAAGEVVERPSSVIKELVENSIDSGADVITVEIKNGGISYIRVTDNGSGISFSDVPTAFLRHATSKLNVKDDLNRIMTLGFRGEALASISAVSKCELITKPACDEYGTHYIIEGTEEKLYEKKGCPNGTTIVVRDIFYNVPARLKFLRNDKYEGGAVASIVSKIAVSHPEISFQFIRSNRQEIFTPGDNKLYSAIYSVFGKEFAASMLPVDYSIGGINITGYTVKPLFGRKNRTMQHFYVNKRYIKSYVCVSAVEEAYRNNLMEGKFPACVLFLEISPDVVDVNVHPAKTEVRFSEDKLIYDALFFAVKNALINDTVASEMVLPRHTPTEADYALPMFSQPEGSVQTQLPDSSVSKFVRSFETINAYLKDGAFPGQGIAAINNSVPYEHGASLGRSVPENTEGEPAASAKQSRGNNAFGGSLPAESDHFQQTVSPDISEHISSGYASDSTDSGEGDISRLAPPPKKDFKYINADYSNDTLSEPAINKNDSTKTDRYFRFIGEAFKNYIIAETSDGILIVDKHAAHERIRFERLRTGRENLTAQMLIEPKKISLAYNEYEELVKNLQICADCGFVIEPAGSTDVIIKGIPSMLDGSDAEDIVYELAKNFAEHRHDPLPERLDDMYHTMACRGAIKANDISSADELINLVEQVFSDDRIKYCPHGRPIMFKLTKKELEKQFKRIV